VAGGGARCGSAYCSPRPRRVWSSRKGGRKGRPRSHDRRSSCPRRLGDRSPCPAGAGRRRGQDPGAQRGVSQDRLDHNDWGQTCRPPRPRLVRTTTGCAAPGMSARNDRHGQCPEPLRIRCGGASASCRLRVGVSAYCRPAPWQVCGAGRVEQRRPHRGPGAMPPRGCCRPVAGRVSSIRVPGGNAVPLRRSAATVPFVDLPSRSAGHRRR